MDILAEYIDEERDVLYIRGERKTQEKAVKKALLLGKLTVNEIADDSDVSTDFVLVIQR